MRRPAVHTAQIGLLEWRKPDECAALSGAMRHHALARLNPVTMVPSAMPNAASMTPAIRVA